MPKGLEVPEDPSNRFDIVDHVLSDVVLTGGANELECAEQVPCSIPATQGHLPARLSVSCYQAQWFPGLPEDVAQQTVELASVGQVLRGTCDGEP